jgi:acid stress-induced BolA-like protein IbaG/YrbA
VEGDGRHWFAVIVSPQFEGKRTIARHQMVYATLESQMQSEAVHALSMHLHARRMGGRGPVILHIR